MSILSFNCRGLNSKLGVLSDYIGSFRYISSPDVIFLTETKGGGELNLNFAQKINYYLACYAPVNGASGGVAIFIKKGLRFSFISSFGNRGIIIDLYLNKFAFRFIGVYGGFDNKTNSALSDWLSPFVCGDCMIAGDFNYFIPPGEDWVDGYLAAGNGPPDTHNKGGSMDKFYLKGFTQRDYIVLHLDYSCSDHRPILLCFPKSDTSTKRFKFPDWILSVPEVVDDLKLFLCENEESDWVHLSSLVARRASNWVTSLLSNAAYKDSMKILRDEFIKKEKVLNLNPCAKSTAAFRKAYFGPKGKGVINIDSAYNYYSALFAADSSPTQTQNNNTINFDFITLDKIKKYFSTTKQCLSWTFRFYCYFL